MQRDSLPATRVMSGADKVTVRRTAKVIKSSSLLNQLRSFLADTIKEQAIAKWEPVRLPAELILPAQTQNIELVPRLVSRGANGQANHRGQRNRGRRTDRNPADCFSPEIQCSQGRYSDGRDGRGRRLTADNTRIEKVVIG